MFVFFFPTVLGLHAGEGAERDGVHTRRLCQNEGKAQFNKLKNLLLLEKMQIALLASAAEELGTK